jgi:hypothetical protein
MQSWSTVVSREARTRAGRADVKPGLRAILVVSVAGVLILLGLVFPQALLNRIILPAATVLWLLLRMFVLSIHQELIWWSMIILAALAVVVALLRGPRGSASLSRLILSRAPYDPVERWKDSLLMNLGSEPYKDTFRRDLTWMLTELHASARPGNASYQVREAFQQGSIPLPPPIYEFLFSSTKPPQALPPLLSHPVERLRIKMRSRRKALQRWARRRRGLATADYFNSIDEVLSFMETSLEMNHELEPEPHLETQSETDG